MGNKIRVGLVGYGKAGYAVANVLSADPRYDLRWIVRANVNDEIKHHPHTNIPVVSTAQHSFMELHEQDEVDAIVDFSSAESLHSYSELVRARGVTLLSAISSYSPEEHNYARGLGKHARVLCSPNMTLGINFLIVAARLLRRIAPFADVEILEQHFREKPEISGTARKLANMLKVNDERITSLRLGGIVGHHEVIFGFPHQTVRLTHESIRREAFGTGAAFALERLSKCKNGFYSFEDLLQGLIREELLSENCDNLQN